MYEVLLLLAVAVIWGFTNPFMKYGIDSSTKPANTSPDNSRVLNLLLEVKWLLLNWKYILAYCINQIGSFLFYYALGQTELSIASPLTNSLTFVFTFLFGHFVFSEKSDMDRVGWCGLGLVISGVVVCLFDKLL